MTFSILIRLEQRERAKHTYEHKYRRGHISLSADGLTTGIATNGSEWITLFTEYGTAPSWSLFYCTCSMRTIRSRNVLQRLRAVLSELGNVAIEPPPQKTFDAEGAILERTLPKCLNDRAIALKDLADSARRVDKAAFGHQVYSGISSTWIRPRTALLMYS